jgi:hypothetical protein
VFYIGSGQSNPSLALAVEQASIPFGRAVGGGTFHTPRHIAASLRRARLTGGDSEKWMHADVLVNYGQQTYCDIVTDFIVLKCKRTSLLDLLAQLSAVIWLALNGRRTGLRGWR